MALELPNKTEMLILEKVIKEPKQIMALVSELGMAHNNILDRLNELEEFNFIYRKKEGKFVTIYPTESGCTVYLVLKILLESDGFFMDVKENFIKIKIKKQLEQFSPEVFRWFKELSS